MKFVDYNCMNIFHDTRKIWYEDVIYGHKAFITAYQRPLLEMKIKFNPNKDK